MEKVIIVRYCEIHLKGKNRGYFEKVFMQNMEKALKGIRHEIHKMSGRYLVENFDEDCTDKILVKLSRVFGTHTLSTAYKVPAELETIYDTVLKIAPESGTFKVVTNRADKTFPLNSMQMNGEIGGRLLRDNPNLRVDVHSPQGEICIDIRQNGEALVFCDHIMGAGGMPVGTAGKGTLLLSGGIDSPVAGHMIAKRGMTLQCLHFHSYPYTNMQAREKVERLAEILSEYTGGLTLHVVSVTQIQEAIHKRCPEEMMITLLRRFMMRIAEKLSLQTGAQCIITGESLGQVASQTIEGMTSSNSVVQQMPVLRPLVGFDKTEIIARARAIGTYETSILPYEDCCTVFLPKHPLIRPKMDDVLRAENKLPVDELIEAAFNSLETLHL
ncbi:MAG TPA: tRNA 4-thiouridine(8) synthase ThiI [Candidatus Borkfalkia excrementigallinarum]|uniref:Probable tRNA sulfurtransferase n=1 Tax=Candidatus Borkfalkia excrementigallinarum TaxID=2838506 RepID=A0A9D2CSW6_9FIRM|nr:tRNA 4-thiouridine(8) synthase ThiI [Candidatus Borkfalkia excrementigallinarum]